MAADYALKFGSFALNSTNGVWVSDLQDEMPVKPRMAETPGRDGAYTAGGLLNKRRIVVQGLIRGSSADDLRSKLEAFRAAMRPGAPAALYLHSDRILYAEVTGVSDFKFGQTARIHVPFQVEWTAVDPYVYAVTPDSADGLEAGGTVTAGGTGYALPTITVEVSDIGTNGYVVLSNDTINESLALIPAEAGEIVVDCRLETVTRNDVDVSAEMSAYSKFLRLAPGANSLTVYLANGAAVSAISMTWQARYV